MEQQNREVAVAPTVAIRTGTELKVLEDHDVCIGVGKATFAVTANADVVAAITKIDGSSSEEGNVAALAKSRSESLSHDKYPLVNYNYMGKSSRYCKERFTEVE